MPATVAPSKEIAELEARLKPGYRFEKMRSGHYAVTNGDGNRVTAANGKVLSVPGTPHGGRQTKNVEHELIRAGVLQDLTQAGTPRVPKSEAEARRQEALKATLAVRSRNRQKVANALHDRLTSAVVKKIGGYDQRGTAADLSLIGAKFARQVGHPELTPDLLMSSATRVRDKAWVKPDAQEVWNAVAEHFEQHEGDVVEEFFRLVREVRGLPETVVVQGSTQLTLPDGEWPFRVDLIDLEHCLIDHSYQRPPYWPFIRKKAASFDATLVGTIDVAERAHGATYAILDGQQRFEMMRLVGKTTCYAAIYVGLSQVEEARFFLHKNQDQKAMHTFYVWKAKIAAGDEEAKAIDKIVAATGFVIHLTSAGGSGAPDNAISAIASCEYVYRLQNDVFPNCLRPTLELMRATTAGRRNGQAAPLIRGIGRFFYLHGERVIDVSRLEGVVADRGPDWFIGRAKEETLISNSNKTMQYLMPRVIAAEYNRGLPAKERLNTNL